MQTFTAEIENKTSYKSRVNKQGNEMSGKINSKLKRFFSFVLYHLTEDIKILLGGPNFRGIAVTKSSMQMVHILY